MNQSSEKVLKDAQTQKIYLLAALAVTLSLSVISIYRVSTLKMQDLYFFYPLRNVTYAFTCLIIYLILAQNKKIKSKLVNKKKTKKAFVSSIAFVMTFYTWYLWYFRDGYANAGVHGTRVIDFFSGAGDGNRFLDGSGWLRLGSDCNYVLSGINVCDKYTYPKFSVQIGLLLDKIDFVSLKGLPLITLTVFVLCVVSIFKITRDSNRWLISILIISPSMVFVIDRANLDFLIMIILVCSLYLLKSPSLNVYQFITFLILFQFSAALKIYTLLAMPLALRKIRKMRRVIFIFVTLINCLNGLRNDWIFVIKNAPEPGIQGSGFVNLFKIWSGDYSSSILNESSSLLVRIAAGTIVILISSAIRSEAFFLTHSLLAFHFLLWATGVSFLYKNIFLVAALICYIFENSNEKRFNDSFVIMVMIANVFLGKADILVNSLNFFFLCYLVTKISRLERCT